MVNARNRPQSPTRKLVAGAMHRHYMQYSRCSALASYIGNSQGHSTALAHSHGYIPPLENQPNYMSIRHHYLQLANHRKHRTLLQSQYMKNNASHNKGCSFLLERNRLCRKHHNHHTVNCYWGIKLWDMWKGTLRWMGTVIISSYHFSNCMNRWTSP